jgi:hypothetical protein
VARRIDRAAGGHRASRARVLDQPTDAGGEGAGVLRGQHRRAGQRTVPVQHRVDHHHRQPGQRGLLEDQCLSVARGRKGEHLGTPVGGPHHARRLLAGDHDPVGQAGALDQAGQPAFVVDGADQHQAGVRALGAELGERAEQPVDALLAVDPADEQDHPIGAGEAVPGPEGADRGLVGRPGRDAGRDDEDAVRVDRHAEPFQYRAGRDDQGGRAPEQQDVGGVQDGVAVR